MSSLKLSDAVTGTHLVRPTVASSRGGGDFLVPLPHPQAFTAWFSVAPLMPAIKLTLHLTKHQIAYANIASVATTIVARVVVGPLCDRFGPKTSMAILLLVGSIPVFCVGSIQSFHDLLAVRFVPGGKE